MRNSKTVSLRRQEAARRNGAKSRGRVTPAGKARSSRNAVKHGCFAASLTFTPEEAVLFNRIHAEYVARLEPRDQVEHDLVEEIARAKWQMRQAWAYQSSLLAMQVVQDAEQVDREWKSIGDQDRRALAYRSANTKDNTLANLHRYSRSFAAEAERALKMLLELRKLPLPPGEEPDMDPVECALKNEPEPVLGNEPGPESGHADPAAESPDTVLEPAARTVSDYALTPAAPRILAKHEPQPKVMAAAALADPFALPDPAEPVSQTLLSECHEPPSTLAHSKCAQARNSATGTP